MEAIVNTFSGVSVDDLGKAREFYVDKLGLALKDETMGLLLELPGGAELFVYDKPDHVPATYTTLNVVTTNINDTIDALVAKGVVFEHYDNMPAPQDEREIIRGKAAQQGPDIAWFKDPAGNVLAILEN